MTNLTAAAKETLAKLRANAENVSEFNGKRWGDVYLDNAIDQDNATRRSLPGILSGLSKAGFYNEQDGYAWGEVCMDD